MVFDDYRIWINEMNDSNDIQVKGGNWEHCYKVLELKMKGYSFILGGTRLD